MTADDTRLFDLEVFGLVVRLHDARPADAHAIEWRLGARRVARAGAANIELRFVPALPAVPQTRVAGDVAFAGSDFALLPAGRRNPARLRVPLAALAACLDATSAAGAPHLELLCEHGAGASPIFTAALHALALGRGMLPLHAAAFAWHGAGTAVLGDSGAGKTGVLLGCLAAGARYLAADWVVVNGDGTRLLGRREPVRLRAWHVRALPEMQHALRGAERVRFAVLGVPGSVLEMMPARLRGAAFPATWVRRVDRRVWVDVPPERVAHDVQAAPRAAFARYCWLVTGAGPQVRITTMEPAAAAAASAASLTECVAPLVALDAAAQAAGLRGTGLCAALPSRLQAQLAAVLGGKRVQQVAVPPGTPLPALVHALCAGENGP